MKVPRWLGVAVAAIYLFLHAPVLVLVVFSFNASKFSVAWTGFTVGWYRALADRPEILDGLWASIVVGVASTAISTVLGTAVALGIGRGAVRGKRVLEALLYLPIVTPEVVVGISSLVLFVALGLPLGLGTIVIAHVAFSISFVAVVVLARIEGMDRSLEEAALVLGADEWTTFRRVTLPQLWPAVVSGALLAFTMSFDDYVITSFVAGPTTQTLPMVVFAMVRKGIEPTINAISTVVLLLTTVLLVLSERAAGRSAR